MKDWYYMFKGLSHGRDLASSSSLLANVLDGLYLQKPNLNRKNGFKSRSCGCFVGSQIYDVSNKTISSPLKLQCFGFHCDIWISFMLWEFLKETRFICFTRYE
jgi:hypothetical protein